MLCTCSRSCSIRTFMSTETVVSSIDADFEPSVLASRCSPWTLRALRAAMVRLQRAQPVGNDPPPADKR